jgi:hypothetical protein
MGTSGSGQEPGANRSRLHVGVATVGLLTKNGYLPA